MTATGDQTGAKTTTGTGFGTRTGTWTKARAKVKSTNMLRTQAVGKV